MADEERVLHGVLIRDRANYGIYVGNDLVMHHSGVAELRDAVEISVDGAIKRFPYLGGPDKLSAAEVYRFLHACYTDVDAEQKHLRWPMGVWREIRTLDPKVLAKREVKK